MAIQTINLGTAPEGKDGDDARTAFTKVNENMDELYPAAIPTTAQEKTAARTRLGLGSAAVKGVGEATGDVMLVGAFGCGSDVNVLLPGGNVDAKTLRSGVYRVTTAMVGVRPLSQGSLTVSRYNTTDSVQTLFSIYGDVYQRGSSNGSFNPWYELYSTKNTTVDGSGFLKKASPIIKLLTDAIETEGFDNQPAPVFERLSKGVYQITGTLGLRGEGWYIETPSDRNGNKYFNVEWEQSITPETNDGVVDEFRDDIVVTIRTFERVWNPATGVFDNGDPVDINDAQDRWIDLRFNELKAEEVEDDPQESGDADG